MQNTIDELLLRAVKYEASDLHITVNSPPVYRIHGNLVKHDGPVVDDENSEIIAKKLLQDKWVFFQDMGEYDFSLNGSHIELAGKGNLTVYVKNKFITNGSFTINEKGKEGKNVNKLNIFYAGEDDINIAGAAKIYGSLFVQDADLTLTGSGGIFGNIVVGGERNIVLTGGSNTESQLLLAPHSNVLFNGGGGFKGKIISDTFKITGGGRVEFDDHIEVLGPLSEEEIVLYNEGNSTETSSSYYLTSKPIREVTN